MGLELGLGGKEFHSGGCYWECWCRLAGGDVVRGEERGHLLVVGCWIDGWMGGWMRSKWVG